jgi:hypothetical protein
VRKWLKRSKPKNEVDNSGLVLVRITVDRIDRKTRKVKAIVIEQDTGKTVYKLRFYTRLGDIAAYNAADDYVKSFVRDHDYVINGEISTNVSLPYVHTVNKRMR